MGLGSYINGKRAISANVSGTRLTGVPHRMDVISKDDMDFVSDRVTRNFGRIDNW